MIHAVNPVLGVRLGTVDGTDVVRLREVVPGANFDQIEEAAVLNDLLPTGVVQV